MARTLPGDQALRAAAHQPVARHVVHVAVVPVIQPAQQVLLVLREVQFGHAQSVKAQCLRQALQLGAHGREVRGCKVGRASHGRPV